MKLYSIFIYLMLFSGINIFSISQSNGQSDVKEKNIYAVVLDESSLNYPYSLPKQDADFVSRMTPLMGAQTAEIHFNKHHQNYVNKLNDATKATEMESVPLIELFKNISQKPIAVRNNGGGHYNHVIFWNSIANKSVSIDGLDIHDAIIRDFGSMDELHKSFIAKSLQLFGSGWVWLAIDADGKLFVSSTANQDNPLMDVVEQQGLPIIGLDVWEHAYYLKFQNNRASFAEQFWLHIDWNYANFRYQNILKQL